MHKKKIVTISAHFFVKKKNVKRQEMHFFINSEIFFKKLPRKSNVRQRPCFFYSHFSSLRNLEPFDKA